MSVRNDKFNKLLATRRATRHDVDDFESGRIFNDDFYEHAKENFVVWGASEIETKLYNEGKIRKLYLSFDQLMLDNIKYYTRILRTVFFLFENKRVREGRSDGNIENPYIGLTRTLYKNKITATQLYYIALLPPDFLYREFELGYPDTDHGISYTPNLSVESRSKMLITLFQNHNRFKILYEEARKETGSEGSDGYSKILERDITSYKYLKTILPYKYQKAISVGLSGMTEESEEFEKSYSKYLRILKKFGTNLPDQHTSITTPEINFFDTERHSWCKFGRGAEMSLKSLVPFPSTVLEYYTTFNRTLRDWNINTEFLQNAMQEMLADKNKVKEFYGIKSLSNGSVASVRLHPRHGAIDIKETTFNAKGQVMYEQITAKTKTIKKASEIIIKGLNYFVFDVDKPNVINTNLNDPQAVVNHVTEVVERFQTEASELHDKYNEEVGVVMDKYIKHIKELKKI